MSRLWLLLLANSLVAGAVSPKKVLIWMANPYLQPDHKPDPITFDTLIKNMQAHRSGFTGIAYQYFAICGEGSDDEGGSKDCRPEDATGTPHLAKGHPVPVPDDLGAQLRQKLGADLELWPVISYGNPGNASVVNALLNDKAATAKFAADAIKIAHAQNLTGFNFDIEDSGISANQTRFLKTFVSALHSATPRIGVSFDAGSTPQYTGEPLMDRWVSMSTYTSDFNAFKQSLAQGMKASGSAFGVGLCPFCQQLSNASVEARFAEIAKYGNQVREIDLWAASYGGSGDGDWAPYWPYLEKWLATP